MTLNHGCSQLDAFLAGDLSVGDVARFESHLKACAECRDALEEQKWVDSLLQSRVRIQLEHAPATILESVHASVKLRERRKRQIAYIFAAAAVLLVGIGWFALDHYIAQSDAASTHDIAAIEATRETPPVQPTATFVSTSDAIVVPLESSSDDVTVVQVYPTTDTERRWRLELTLSGKSTEHNGG